MNTPFGSSINIYKANKNGTGSAVQFQLSKRNKCMFLEIAKQLEEKNFDWQNKIVVKLGIADMTKILSLLNGTWPPDKTGAVKVSLFHDNPKGSKVIGLAKQTKYPGFYLTVSIDEDGRKDRIACPISPDESEFLKVGISKALEFILNW